MRTGVRLGIDVGTVRIGVARSDFHAILSTPVGTVSRGHGAVPEIVKMIQDLDAMEVVVGLPLALSGAHTASTQDAEDFATHLANSIAVPVRLVDERLSTVSAQNALHSAGRNTRTSRPIIDQVAATIILQHALDVERSSGNPPGDLIVPDEG
ncbi:MAG: Holliday junction resolvase RuvX [Terrimesophilobacter sp.]